MIVKNIEVPTGNILVIEGEKGLLECLSLGDYGKDVNLHSDALGLSRPIDSVKHTELLPLEEKWVITISSQYGCSSRCQMCDVPKVRWGVNASTKDLVDQVKAAMSLHPEVTHSARLNIHFARMGEPTWNPNVITATRILIKELPDFHIHPVVSTMMPRENKKLEGFLREWLQLKNELGGEAGLQLSINCTDDWNRNHSFGGSSMQLMDIATLMYKVIPVTIDNKIELLGRKITLNFAVADYEIDPQVLIRYFDPKFYIVKLTPMHLTDKAIENNIKTRGDYTTMAPYVFYEENLKLAGYDVLVFIASEEEDTSKITCGNAILAGPEFKEYRAKVGAAQHEELKTRKWQC